MSSEAYTLEEVERELYETYRWWHEQAPGVTPKEEGTLGALWGLFDLLIEEEEST